MQMKLNRRSFLKSAGFAVAAAGLNGCTESQSAGAGHAERVAGGAPAKRGRDALDTRPNIIYVLADDLGYGDLGCYGQKAIQTPNIDRMAAEGMRFSRHYAGSTVCAPSRCCLMTGLHTGHSYVRGNREAKPLGQLPLPEGTVTVAGLLKQAGYATGLTGKWGLGGPDSTGAPNRQGFDYFFGYLCQRHAHNYYPEFLFENQQRVPLRNKVAEPREDGAGVAVEKVDYSHDLIAEKALAFIERHRKGPFFLYMAVTIPHANNEAGKAGMEVPDVGIYADKDWPDPQKGHAAMISRLDRDMGRLLDLLKRLGIDDETLVVFSSDNGPHKEGGADPAFFGSSGPLRGYKRDLYEGGIRVPLIARWPGRIAAGSGCNHISAFWDMLPTFAELAGIEAPDGLDGISMVPSLLGRPDEQRSHDYLYWEFHERGGDQAVRMGDWKAIRLGRANRLELYNLKDDPGESVDIADQCPETVEKAKKLLIESRTESEFWPLQ